MKTNTPNPLIPQGTFPPHRKSHVRIAVFSILAVHVILLGALLLQGCKRTADTGSMQPTNASTTPEFDQATNYALVVEPAQLPASTVPPEPIDSGLSSVPPPGTQVISPPPALNYGTPPISTTSSYPVEAAGVSSTHVVLKGENFTTIARKYGVSSKAIAKANPNINPRGLRIGEKITIPAPPPPSTPAPSPGNLVTTSEGSIYVVKSGDNLSTIAKRFGTTVSAFKSANALTSDKLKVGDKLKIPAGTHADNGLGAPRYP